MSLAAHPTTNEKSPLETSSQLTISHNLPSASDIEGYRDGKHKRSLLHAVVHAFRAAHGYNGESINESNPFSKLVENFYRMKISDLKELDAINRVSSVSGYTDIRQAGRMRASMHPLPNEIIEQLCKEIKAAFIWRALNQD